MQIHSKPIKEKKGISAQVFVKSIHAPTAIDYGKDHSQYYKTQVSSQTDLMAQTDKNNTLRAPRTMHTKSGSATKKTEAFQFSRQTAPHDKQRVANLTATTNLAHQQSLPHSSN